MRRINFIWFIITLFSVLFLVGSCSKDNIIINIDSTNPSGDSSSNNNKDNNNDNDSSSTKKSTLYYSANVLSLISRSSSTDPISVNKYVTVFAYNNSSLISSTSYKSESTGSLAPIDNVQMTLTSGTYDFYAAGVNTTGNSVPTFSSGIASNLQNELDYIWCKVSSFTTVTGNNNLTLNLNHLCSQVVVSLTPASGIVIDSIVSMSITPSSTTGSKWDLLLGEITPATSISSTAIDMGVTLTNNNSTYTAVGQAIMLPLNYTGNLTSYFTIIINSESNSRNYSLPLPVYDNSFTEGNSYVYKATLGLDTITFNSVNIIDWVTVDANGSPIIPTQITD